MATLSPLGQRLATEAQRLIADAKAARLAAGGGIPDDWDRAIERDYPNVWPPYKLGVPGGWCDLIAAFSLQMRRHAPGCVVTDSKEKYGLLRIDTGGDGDMLTAHALEWIYESASESVCQDCGERGGLRIDRGWYAALCDVHADVRDPR
jgi:hypothetical protein